MNYNNVLSNLSEGSKVEKLFGAFILDTDAQLQYFWRVIIILFVWGFEMQGLQSLDIVNQGTAID